MASSKPRPIPRIPARPLGPSPGRGGELEERVADARERPSLSQWRKTRWMQTPNSQDFHHQRRKMLSTHSSSQIVSLRKPSPQLISQGYFKQSKNQRVRRESPTLSTMMRKNYYTQTRLEDSSDLRSHAFIRPAYEWVISPTGRDGPQILFNYRNTSLYIEMNVRYWYDMVESTVAKNVLAPFAGRHKNSFENTKHVQCCQSRIFERLCSGEASGNSSSRFPFPRISIFRVPVQ